MSISSISVSFAWWLTDKDEYGHIADWNATSWATGVMIERSHSPFGCVRYSASSRTRIMASGMRVDNEILFNESVSSDKKHRFILNTDEISHMFCHTWQLEVRLEAMHYRWRSRHLQLDPRNTLSRKSNKLQAHPLTFDSGGWSILRNADRVPGIFLGMGEFFLKKAGSYQPR
jgi:hypothetical protein